jgi:hypothetical protein
MWKKIPIAGVPACAVSVLMRLLSKRAEGRKQNLLRQLTYLELKGKGEISMSGKRLNKKVGIVMCRKSCPQEISSRERG